MPAESEPHTDALSHDPLDDIDLDMLRAWLLHQPDDRAVSVYTARRMLATIDAERGLAAEVKDVA
jgi:hypothetical protein